MAEVKTVFIAGEPATGKTTLMRRILPHLGPPQDFAYGKAKGTFHPERKVWVLGLYPPGETFGGTDRLAMTVINDAKEWLLSVPKLHCVLLEGDRLANGSFLNFAKEAGALELFLLIAREDALRQRHEARGDTQAASWLAGRRTKLLGLKKQFPFRELENETEPDGLLNAARVWEALTGLWEPSRF